MSPSSTLIKQRSFRGWFKRATGTNTRKVVPETPRGGVFGVPLSMSIKYAKTTVGYVDDDGIKHSKAGAIPIVVAKCGSYLKKHGLDTEGVFRISGSYKRMNELEYVFDQGSCNYGLDLNWDSYTVHDAASILRRFLNKLPDPVIPFEFYSQFRDVMNDKAYNDTEHRIEAFQRLIQCLPPPHQHLLLYLLDTLNLFASNCSETKMNTSNLAAVFCPGILRHPDHNTPIHYKISQYVIEFLIEFQSLFTMQLLVPTRRKKPSSVSSSLGEVPPVPLLLPSSTQKPTPPLPLHIDTPRTPLTPLDNISPIIPEKSFFVPSPRTPSIISNRYSITPTTAPSIKPNNTAPSRTPSVKSSRSSSIKSTRRSIQSYSPALSTPLQDTDDESEEEPSLAATHHSPYILNNPHIQLTWQKLAELLKPWIAQPTGFLICVFILVITLIVIVYEAYLAYTLCTYEPLIFFASLVSYWYLLFSALPPAPEDMYPDIDMDPKVMLEDEKIRSTWHGLLTRSWRSNDVAEDNDTMSIMSKSSRFDEEEDQNSISSSEEDEELGFDPDILTSYLDKYDQIKKDAQLAKKLQIAEQKARDLNNPFMSEKTPPAEGKEEWKIRVYPKS